MEEKRIKRVLFRSIESFEVNGIPMRHAQAFAISKELLCFYVNERNKQAVFRAILQSLRFTALMCSILKTS